MNEQKSKRPHCDLIIAFAQGESIERYDDYANKWILDERPTWSAHYKYRILEEKIIKGVCLVYDNGEVVINPSGQPNVNLVFGQTTNQLLNVEMIGLKTEDSQRRESGIYDHQPSFGGVISDTLAEFSKFRPLP